MLLLGRGATRQGLWHGRFVARHRWLEGTAASRVSLEPSANLMNSHYLTFLEPIVGHFADLEVEGQSLVLLFHNRTVRCLEATTSFHFWERVDCVVAFDCANPRRGLRQ